MKLKLTIMATINDKLEQQNAQTRELTDDELNQATGGDSDSDLELVLRSGFIPGGCPPIAEDPIETPGEFETPL